MSRTTSLTFFWLLLALFVVAVIGDQTPLAPSDPHTSNSWAWDDCGLPGDVVEIKSLTLKPDPPQPGQNLTITASGHVSTTIEDGAYAQVAVKLGLIKLLQKTFNICEEAKNANVSIQCPVDPGDYTVVQTVALPKEIPPAKFVVEVRAFNADDNDLMCANIHIDFMSGLKSGLFGR